MALIKLIPVFELMSKQISHENIQFAGLFVRVIIVFVCLRACVCVCLFLTFKKGTQEKLDGHEQQQQRKNK